MLAIICFTTTSKAHINTIDFLGQWTFEACTGGITPTPSTLTFKKNDNLSIELTQNFLGGTKQVRKYSFSQHSKIDQLQTQRKKDSNMREAKDCSNNLNDVERIVKIDELIGISLLSDDHPGLLLSLLNIGVDINNLEELRDQAMLLLRKLKSKFY